MKYFITTLIILDILLSIAYFDKSDPIKLKKEIEKEIFDYTIKNSIIFKTNDKSDNIIVNSIKNNINILIEDKIFYLVIKQKIGCSTETIGYEILGYRYDNNNQ